MLKRKIKKRHELFDTGPLLCALGSIFITLLLVGIFELFGGKTLFWFSLLSSGVGLWLLITKKG